MATPRQTVRDWILTKLRAISIANGYHLDIVTVDWRDQMIRNVGIDDCPAILLTSGPDRPTSETMGKNTGNQHFREWTMELVLCMTDDTNFGEVFLADVQKCLITNRFNSDKPSDIQFEVASHEVDRLDNGIAQFNLGLTVRYNFTLGDLS